MTENIAARPASRSNGVQIFQTVFVTFLAYLAIGLPLAVLPTHVHTVLGFGAVLAGFSVSAQSLATIFSRAHVGRMTDRRGARPAVTLGFLVVLASGVVTWAAGRTDLSPGHALGLILAARLGLGAAESWVGTGAITWAIGLVGPGETVRIISWNGIASYGGIAVGAPLGVFIDRSFGFGSLGAATCVLALLGLAITRLRAAVPIVPAPERGTGPSVLRLVFPYGFALALATSGFGVIAAFVTLLFDARHWSGAAASLSLFGLAFIAARLLFSPFILRYGGLRVTAAALAVEGLGLLMLWSAPGPLMATAGAGVAGFGFSPVFPALGVVAVGRVPDANRGEALGLYTVFLDVALAGTGPLAGLLVDRFGTASPFLLAAAATMASFAVTAALLSR